MMLGSPWEGWRYPAAQVLVVAVLSASLAWITADRPSPLHLLWMVIVPLGAGAVLNRSNGCMMPVLLLCASLTVVLIVRSVNPFEPPRQFLPRGSETQYKTILKFWDDPDLIWRPFELEVRADDDPGFDKHLLFAEQCADVGVIQTSEFLNVFYDEIALTSFSGFRYGNEPKPILCDLALPQCAAEKDRLLHKGATLIQVCPSKAQKRTSGP